MEEEERAYEALLAQLDALARWPDAFAGQGEVARRVNQLWDPPPRAEGSGLGERLARQVADVMAPTVARQKDFNSAVVQLLNGHLEESARTRAHLERLVSTLVQHLQRVLPLMDARDRVATGLATTRAELILEAFDRRQESLSRRFEGLLALRDRVETLSEEMRALRGTGKHDPDAPASAILATAVGPLDTTDATYVAFENRFRGDPAEIRARLQDYVPLFEGLAPVLDLGCGRGEFLDLLRAAGIQGRGVEANMEMVAACRRQFLDVVHNDILGLLRGEADASLGGVFAAQVAEHLPPPVLQATLREIHRVLRPGGRMILETVNPTSVSGFLDVYIRDLTHERPLHPDTLRFLAAAAGFTDVRVELRSPVDPAAQLRTLPEAALGALPPAVVEVMNENVARLNTVLFAPQDYALIAQR